MNTSSERAGFVRRTLCRNWWHKWRTLAPEESPDPCRYYRGCVFCSQVIGGVRPNHQYGELRPTDHTCVKVSLCTGCGDRKTQILHKYRDVPLNDLPEQLRYQVLRDLAKRAPAFLSWSPSVESVPCTWAGMCALCGKLGETSERHNLKNRRDGWEDIRCRTPGCRYVDFGDDEGDAT